MNNVYSQDIRLLHMHFFIKSIEIVYNFTIKIYIIIIIFSELSILRKFIYFYI